MDEQGQGESIEFQEVTDSLQLTDIVRTSFRIPVKEKTDIFVIIDKISYFLADVSAKGIGISIDSADSFSQGDILSKCELNILGKSMKGLKGEVVHLTPDIDGKWLYGIKWIDLSDDAEKILNSVFLDLKQELLE
ncbi:MAG: PilZ domain-containing protein [Thermodesulfobacteriota bacterium]|nr:PilZ domain-containing protein [Thermodesulfobacteriota bacterium]